MAWIRRVLRCAVLHESPGEDVLAPMSHTLCRFGSWFMANKAQFAELNPQNTRRLEAVHQTMHDVIRSICTDMLAGRMGQRTDLESFEQSQNELIDLMAQFKTLFLINAAQHDPLTGLRLRGGIENEFIQVQKICRRNNTQMYVGIIDVDHFKRVNDAYGHPVGDMVLRHLADTLKSTVRPNEPLFRWGGEEFLLLIQCQTREAATTAAKRIVQSVRSAPAPIQQGDPLALTVTMGLAQVRGDETMASAIKRADRALYAGKEAGRDRYVIANDCENSA